MEISKELQTALIEVIAVAKAVTNRGLLKDEGGIEIVEQFLFDCEIDEEKFEAFPRLSEMYDEEMQLRKEEKEHYADYSDQREGEV